MQKTTMIRADAAGRAQRAWNARVAGASWDQAAELAGLSSGAVACRAVSRYFGKLPQVDRAQQQAMWRERLEHLWRLAARDAQEQRPGAIRAGVAVAQRAAALDGLDAPTTVQLVTPEAAEFSRVVDMMVMSVGAAGVGEADVFELEEADPA